MAQLVEQRPYKAKVGSSSLSGSTVTPARGLPVPASGRLVGMRSRPAALSVLPLAVVLAVAGCTAETPPAPGGSGAVPVDSGAPAEPEVPTIVPVEDPAAVLQVEDQTSEGPTVLAKAAATKGGFIVVYSEEGRNELGSSIVPPGTAAANVQISLAEEPTEEIALLARLFADTDGNGLFSAGDMPITNGQDDDSDDAEVFLGEQETFSFTGKKVVNS